MVLANSTGLRPGSTITLGPNLSRVVRAAAKVMATTGSSDGPPARSATHSESNPSRSRPSTIAPSVSWSPEAAPPPIPTPMRTLMVQAARSDSRRARSKP